MRCAPAQSPARNDDGFILIEVLVSALILAIVAAGVMAVLSSTTHSAASERVRSQAAALAQEDQARLRTMRISTLQRLEQTNGATNGAEIVLDGTQFTVRSEGRYVGSATNEISCTAESSATDYVRIISTVSSPAMPTPVVMQSMVSPSSGSVDQSHGTLSFNVKNAKGQPLSGVSISGTGPGSFSGRTDSTGCANFSDLPAGNYKVTSKANGMVNMTGESEPKTEYGAPSAATQTVSLYFETPATIEPKFVYKDPSTGLTRAGKTDAIEVFNGEAGKLPTTYGTPGGTRSSTFRVTNVFPFQSKTNVYAGSCESNYPGSENPAAFASLELLAGQVYGPTIQLPALNLTVQKEGTALSGATVTTTDTKCGVTRTYTTDTGGHLREGEIGMPWGEYKVCTQTAFGTRTRKLEQTVSVKNLTAGTTLVLNVKSSSPSVEGTC